MPDVNQVHTDAVLSNLAIQYSQDMSFIGDRALPVLSVVKESDVYYKYMLKDAVNRPVNTLRADGSESVEDTWAPETDTYQCEEYALKDIVTDRSRQNADKPLNLDQDTTKILTGRINLDKEMRVAAAVFNAATFTSYTSALAAAHRWDNYATSDSDPFDDIEDGKASVKENSLMKANTLIISEQTFTKLRHHPALLDRIKYGGTPANPATVSADAMAAAFGLDQVLVGGSIYNSATEGQTVTSAYVWGKFAMIAYIAPTPPLKGVTLGMQPRSQQFRTDKWRESKRKGDFIEVSMVSDEVITAAGAGYLFSTVIS